MRRQHQTSFLDLANYNEGLKGTAGLVLPEEFEELVDELLDTYDTIFCLKKKGRLGRETSRMWVEARDRFVQGALKIFKDCSKDEL